MASLTLRIKTKSGQQVLKGLPNETSIAQFKQKISELTGIAANDVKILSGFPPAPVTLNDDVASVGTIFRSGDTLIVQEEATPASQANEKAAICTDSKMCRQVVPANNSCLFTSINFCMDGEGRLNLDVARSMRELIATVVSSDPEFYTEGILDKSNNAYCQWIMNDESWGGAIEVSILSNFYSVEIAVVDTETVRIDRFGEDKNYMYRIFLIYDGIHYDPLYKEKEGGQKQVKFLTSDANVMFDALKLAEEAKASRQYTNVNKFSIRCLVCNERFIGQTEAQLHAKKTGHINFGEV